MAKVRKRYNRSGKLLIGVIALVLCIIIIFATLRIKRSIEEKALREQELREQIAEQEQIAEDLQKESEYINTIEYLERLAREKLGMIKEDDIIFKKDN